MLEENEKHGSAMAVPILSLVPFLTLRHSGLLNEGLAMLVIQISGHTAWLALCWFIDLPLMRQSDQDQIK